jgi:hypothetical protein
MRMRTLTLTQKTVAGPARATAATHKVPERRPQAVAAPDQSPRGSTANVPSFSFANVPLYPHPPGGAAADSASKCTLGRCGDRMMRMPDASMPARAANIRRKCNQCEEEAKARPGDDAVARQTAAVTERAFSRPLRPRGSPLFVGAGAALDRSLETAAAARLGFDFSRVRLHDDEGAHRAARELGATAFTLGRHIGFSRGAYAPGSASGRSLILHELVHTAQQGLADPPAGARVGAVPIDAAAEAEAAAAPALRRPRISRRPLALALQAQGGAAQTLAPTVVPDLHDPIVLIEVVASTQAAVLTTRGGIRYEGRVTDLSLEPGVYELSARRDRHIWIIRGTTGGLRFTLEIPAADGGLLDPFTFSYQDARLIVRAAPAVSDDASAMSLDERMRLIGEKLDQSVMWGNDEELVVHLLEDAPASQSNELLRRLGERRSTGRSWLEDLDRRIDGDNNLKLHEALSFQRMRAAPERAVANLVRAPVLPWHDVMGFTETPATFTAERAGNGRVRIRYLGAISGGLLTSDDFGDEVSTLPLEIFIGGHEYPDEQPLIIHDYDGGRFVTVLAGELAGFEHLAMRNFLGHVATVASFAVPVSAAESVAGRIAVVTLERVLPAAFLLIDENRLNIQRWFPNWGPRMIRYSDMVKTAVAAVGLVRVAVSGIQIFRQWRAIRNARAALEGSARLDAEAARVAALLEHDADTVIAQAEALHAAEPPTAPARPVRPPDADVEALEHAGADPHAPAPQVRRPPDTGAPRTTTPRAPETHPSAGAAGSAAAATAESLEAPVLIAGERHALRLVQTENGLEWCLCTDCKRIVDWLRELRAGSGLTPQVADRLDDMIAFASRLRITRDVSTMRALLRTMAEAEQIVPGQAAAALSAARSAATPLSGTPAQIAARAAELEDRIFRELFERRSDAFRGASREMARDELRREARARAFRQAQAELRGDPLALPAGGAARTTVNPATDIPMGFFDRPSFEAVGHAMHGSLSSVAPDAELVLQGSGVTGRHFDRLVNMAHTGAPFNVGSISDYDVAIISDSLIQRARALEIPVSGTRPLRADQLRALGLEPLNLTAHASVLDATGIPHEVHFKLFGAHGGGPGPRLPLPR